MRISNCKIITMAVLLVSLVGCSVHHHSSDKNSQSETCIGEPTHQSVQRQEKSPEPQKNIRDIIPDLKCQTCNGEGEVICKECKNQWLLKEKCPECRGAGKIRCPECSDD